MIRRSPHCSRWAVSAASDTTSTSVKSAVDAPTQDEPDRSRLLVLSSTEPVGCTQRRRTPVDVPSHTVVRSWLAKPYCRCGPARTSASPSTRRPNTPIEVSAASSSHPVSAPLGSGSGMASCAGPASRAAASAARTRSASCAGSVTAALELTTPAAVPPSTYTTAITVSRQDVVCPFVVIVELAHRSTASLDSVTSTAQPGRWAAVARVRSTTSWARSAARTAGPVTDPLPAC